jgi:hypothetical protein
MHSISAVADIAATPQQVCAVLAAGTFDGTNQLALEDLGEHTRLTQSETFRGVLVPSRARSSRRRSRISARSTQAQATG